MANLVGTTVTGNLGVTGTIGGQGAVPVGGIIPIAANLTGAYSAPSSGQVDADGWQLCDGEAVPGSQTLSGNTPDFSDGRFLRGFTSGGGTGGAATFTIGTTNMPSHSHGTSSNHPHNHGNTDTHPGSTGNQSASHSHSGNTGNSNLSHGHNAQKTAPEGYVHTSSGAATGGHWTQTPYGTGGALGNHTHPFGTGNQSANHTHTFDHSHGIGTDNHTHTIPAEGGGNAITHLPIYLNVVYLIRVI